MDDEVHFTVNVNDLRSKYEVFFMHVTILIILSVILNSGGQTPVNPYI